jgi:hypothetical protein
MTLRDAIQKDMAWTKFELTPLFVESSLILCTPFVSIVQKITTVPQHTPSLHVTLRAICSIQGSSG